MTALVFLIILDPILTASDMNEILMFDGMLG